MCIKFQLQTLIDFLLFNFELGHPPPRTPLKRQTRVTEALISPFYSSSWLTDINAFQQGVSYFKTTTLHFPSPPFQSSIDLAVKQSIASAITSAIIVAVDAIQAKHEEEMLALQTIIAKSLLLKEFLSAVPPPNLVATPKVHPSADSLPKTIRERWNQADLVYFDPHLDRVHEEGEIVSVGKDVYYRNIVLFV